jgi:hypothetical protein
MYLKKTGNIAHIHTVQKCRSRNTAPKLKKKQLLRINMHKCIGADLLAMQFQVIYILFHFRLISM